MQAEGGESRRRGLRPERRTCPGFRLTRAGAALTLACPGLNQEWTALGLDGLLHVSCEAVIVFLTLAAIVLAPTLASLQQHLRRTMGPTNRQESLAAVSVTDNS